VFKNKTKKINNIHFFNTQNETSHTIQKFYEKNPFPSYSIWDDKQSIKKKGENNFLANQIKKLLEIIKNFRSWCRHLSNIKFFCFGN